MRYLETRDQTKNLSYKTWIVTSSLYSPGFDGRGQIHDAHGGPVKDPELHRGVVRVPELPHLVAEVVGVHQADGGGKGEAAVGAADALEMTILNVIHS